MILAVAAVLCSTTAFAQTDKPPMVGDKPLVQVQPKGAKAAAGTKAAAAAPAPKGKPQSVAARLQACLEIDDATKERLNCYDEIFKPQPKPKPSAAKGVNDCRFLKEEDERLTCYNGFADKIPKLPK
jgi:uncharacterized protein YciW